MTDSAIWLPVEQELDRWRRRGEQAVFWLRDDDAVDPSAPLDRLLDATQRHAVPLTLAVIPHETGQALVRRLGTAPHVSVAVHGWSHENHAPAGEKKQELGRHRAADVVLGQLRAGAAHLSRLHGDRFAAVLVPPWNRIEAALLSYLPGIGYSGLSVFGPEQPSAIRTVNTHVDLIDWKLTRGGREPAALVDELVARMRQTGDTGGTVGLLTHHLVHDENAWSFLERLFDLTSDHPACRWLPVSDLLADRR